MQHRHQNKSVCQNQWDMTESFETFKGLSGTMGCAVVALKVLENTVNWEQKQFIKPSLQKRSETLSKLRTETGTSDRSATSLHTLAAVSCSNRLVLSVSPVLILTHTGGCDCTQDTAAQPAPSLDSPSHPLSRPSGMGCPASLHLPQSVSPAAVCQWAPPPEDRALWPPPPSDS